MAPGQALASGATQIRVCRGASGLGSDLKIQEIAHAGTIADGLSAEKGEGLL
jgi:hypothetical protein